MFIVVEGIDGAGKTTQTVLLADKFRLSGIEPVVAYEPGSTELGVRVRRLVKGENGSPILLTERAELLLFGAARAQLLEEIVRPALRDGRIILCDRYIYSTVAYQGAGRGLDTDLISTVNALATDGLLPDVVVLLDLPVAAAQARQQGRAADRFDQESVAFYERVRASYLQQAATDAARWIVVDASRPVEEITADIWERVEERCGPA